MISNKKNDLTFITWMQMIGCVLVILGHSYPFIIDVPVWAFKLREFIYIFHMPLFVWCSGYLLVATNQTQKYTIFKYVKHRAIHILVPYFAFSCIGIIPKILFSSVLNDKFQINEIIRAFLVPREGIWGHFWFLPMIFFLDLIGYVITNLLIGKKEYTLIGIVCLLFGIIGYFAPTITGWFSLNDMIHYFIYLIIGMLYAKERSDTVEKNSIFWSICIILLSVLSYEFVGNSKIVKLLISALMLYAIMMIAKLLSKKIFIDRTSIFAQTYSIFILSWPMQLVIEVLLERVFVCNFYIIFTCEFIVGIFAPIIAIKFVELLEKKKHVKLLSIIIGR